VIAVYPNSLDKRSSSQATYPFDFTTRPVGQWTELIHCAIEPLNH
jgi:hypothetical protein